MRRKYLIAISILLFATTSIFGQTHGAVKLSDDVYQLLVSAETKGLCSTLKHQKPYTESYIVSKLEEIAGNLEAHKTNTSETELEIVKTYLDRFSPRESNPFALRFVTKNNKDDFPITFGINGTMEGFFSGGIYDNSSKNSFGFEEWQTLGFFGDLGPYVSYSWDGGIEFMKMPIVANPTGSDPNKYKDLDYYIGSWWDETNGYPKLDPKDEKMPHKFERFIKTYKNNSVLPYHYYKHFDGSIYNLDDFNAGGLKGWPNTMSFGLTMQGSITASFLKDRLTIGISRHNREWNANDFGSSLALNANARPFVGLDLDFQVLDWFSFAGTTGFLEFPNQPHVTQAYDSDSPLANNNGYDAIGKDGKPINIEPYVQDSYFFQNMFTINVMNFDFKYFHGDFGSIVVFPKRFELGYLVPMFEKVIYQNNLGDFDNLSLFGTLRGQVPGFGSVWLSGYVEEMNAPDIKKMFEKSRCMFAYQVGLKGIFPLIPFGTISFRYTKIEPYCYTHISTRNPYTSSYNSTAYMNNGSPLGYYLDPNSDEFYFRIDGRPVNNLTVGMQYQLIRHGTTWGDGQVPGSSIYSEMQPSGRADLTKYFLKDGVYQWTNMFVVDASYDLRSHKLPMKFTASIGYIYDFFTESGSAGNPAGMKLIEKGNNLYDQYPTSNGVVLSMGCKFFTF